MSKTVKLDLDFFEQCLLDLQADVLGVGELASGSAAQNHMPNQVASTPRQMANIPYESQHQQLTLISDALQRIDDDRYGQCQNCHQVIDLENLKANPVIQFCQKCTSLV